MKTREYHLARRPAGVPSADDFTIAERDLPPLKEREVKVRNLFLSVDPYMRGRMRDVKSYAPPYELGTPLIGGAVGRVEESRSPSFAPDDLVLSNQGWREGFVSEDRALTRIDPSIARPSAYLGVLGMPGLTAYAGLFDVGRLVDGETVLVSGAAGAVGATVCQIAKLRGCRVVGVVGSAEKAEWLTTEAGANAAINYRTVDNLRRAIRDAAPAGVDLTFENVGGGHLEAALACSNDFARIVICGLISEYNASAPSAGPSNLRDVLTKRLTMRGFIVTDHAKLYPDFHRDMTAWIKEGKIRWTETVIEGFERMPEAFLGLFEGRNMGKMVVRV